MKRFITASGEFLKEYFTGNNNNFKGLSKLLKEN